MDVIFNNSRLERVVKKFGYEIHPYMSFVRIKS